MIPFNSDIKFNLFIRDMNKDNKTPENKDDNMMVIMKGAPDRIIDRCSKILIENEERDFNEYEKD